jgi:hypothetical protein
MVVATVPFFFVFLSLDFSFFLSFLFASASDDSQLEFRPRNGQHRLRFIFFWHDAWRLFVGYLVVFSFWFTCPDLIDARSLS